ncbi:MAG: hypothetical protein GWP10_07755, partial [Nitrospiraceae bacterium]|nr:hypothetical protein [Nitrospiraceae bacterium]
MWRAILFLIFFALGTLSFCQTWALQCGAEQIHLTCNRWPDCSTLEAFGNSCTRIEGAHSPEGKAIAVWRFIQQTTEVGSPPKEPAYGNNYVISPIKLLNVYGVHWCDGLSRIMTMTWRAMGYRAEKLYKFGHTLADCWWADADGIDRWHVFDVSQHWFVYDRTGTHIATPEELSLDHSLIFFPSRTPIPSWPSLMQPSYVHAGHLRIEPHDMGLTLREGEIIRFQWGNEGKPYLDLFKKKRRDFEHGPYEITFGNGRLIYSPLISRKGFLKTLWQEPVNISCTEMDGLSPALHPREAGKRAEAIIRVSIPYVISDAWFEAKLQRHSSRDIIQFAISTDGGNKWHTIPFNPSRNKGTANITPFGRYNFLFRIEMKAAGDIEGCGIEELRLVVVFQHNLFSLPMLMPGENIITVSGSLGNKSSLRIHYAWDDRDGKDRTSDVIAERLPFQYGISTSGSRWNDVICRSLTLSLVPRNEVRPIAKTRPLGEHKIAILGKGPVIPIGKFIGRHYPRPLRPSTYYIQDLRGLLEKERISEADPATLKGLSRAVGHDVLALAALRNPASREVLEDVIERDITHPYRNKVWACQALYQSVGAASAPMMLRILERDRSIVWNDPAHRWSKDAMWLHTVGMAAAILGKIRNFPGRQRAADIIAEILEGKEMRHRPEKIWRGKEICWGLIRALGKLGMHRHVDVLRGFLPERSDATALAVKALQDIGDKSVVPDLVDLLKDYRYSPIGLYCIEALGTLGTKAQAKYLYPFLHYWDEDFRGMAARSLGEMGDIDAVPLIRQMIQKETQ